MERFGKKSQGMAGGKWDLEIIHCLENITLISISPDNLFLLSKDVFISLIEFVIFKKEVATNFPIK